MQFRAEAFAARQAVMVVYADMPLIRPETLAIAETHAKTASRHHGHRHRSRLQGLAGVFIRTVMSCVDEVR